MAKELSLRVNLAFSMAKKGVQDGKRGEAAVGVEGNWLRGNGFAGACVYLRKESLKNVPFLLLPSRKYRQIIPLDISLFKKNRIHY